MAVVNLCVKHKTNLTQWFVYWMKSGLIVLMFGD